MQRVKRNGKLVVFSNPVFPPYEYIDSNGDISGVEIDLVKQIALTLGVKAEIVASDFATIQAAVESGKADMGVSGFSITDSQKMKVDFSIPITSSVLYMILPVNSKYRAIEMLAGKKIGVQKASTALPFCKKITSEGFLKNMNVEIKTYPDASEAILAMKAGQIDAIIVHELVAFALTRKNKGFKAIPIQDLQGKEIAAAEDIGVMIALGNEDFLTIINQVIKDMKRDCSLEASFIKHFDASLEN